MQVDDKTVQNERIVKLPHLWSLFRGLLRPVVYPDPIENRISIILHLSFLIGMVAELFIFLISLTSVFPPQLSTTVSLISLFCLLVFFGAFYLLKRGFLKLASIVVIGFLYTITTFDLYTGEGLHDKILVIFPGCYLVFSLLIRQKTYWVLIFVQLSIVTAIGIGEIQGIVTSELSPYTVLSELILVIFLLLVSAVIIRLLTNYLVRVLDDAQKNAQNYKEIFNATSEAVFILQLPELKILNFNQSAELMFGYTSETMHSLDLRDICLEIEPYTAAEAIKLLQNVSEVKSKVAEWRLKDKDGQQIWVEISGNSSIIDNKQTLLMTIRDITHRKKASLERERLRTYLANVIDSIPSILIGIDSDSRVNQWNKKATRITGLDVDQVKGRSVNDVIPQLSPDMDIIWDALARKEVKKSVHDKAPDQMFGEFYTVTIFPIISDTINGAVIQIDDMTEQRKTQEAIIQAEKMMSLGGLAAGMAHEINNPLGVILQSSRLIQKRLSNDNKENVEMARKSGVDMDNLRRYLEQRKILKSIDRNLSAVERATTIVSNMLQFSRRSDSNLVPININWILDRSIEMANNDFNIETKRAFRDIHIEKNYDTDLPEVPCIQNEIEQVILNILKNASQAIHTTNRHRLPKIQLKTYQDQRMARIEIKDNGPGIPEEVLHRIFEPFYTTKPAGEGTGLGLSISYMIVNQNHKGTLVVQSELGQGTCFTISLPLENAH